MLTESYLLSKALDDACITSESQHPKIKAPGESTGPVIRVCLDIQGNITRCECIVKENIAGLWAHFNENQNGFPVIRLTQPLLKVQVADDCKDINNSGLIVVRQRKNLIIKDNIASLGGHFEENEIMKDAKENKRGKLTAEQHRKLLIGLLESSEPAIINKSTLNLFIRLRKKSEMIANMFEGKIDSITQICRSFNHVVLDKAVNENQIPLLNNLREKAIKWLEKCDEYDLEALEVLLFTASGKTGKKKSQIAIDMSDVTGGIYTADIRKQVICILLRNEASINNTTTKSTLNNVLPSCAYTRSIDLWTEPFPRVPLPVLGREFYIFSMNSDAQCNVRYGLKDYQLCPVAKEIVLNMQDSLKYIVASERKGKTWRSIPSEKPGSIKQPRIYDLLIAYVDGMPANNLELADFFGESEDCLEQQFNADASLICESLDGIRRQKPESRLNLIILRKAPRHSPGE